MKLNYYGFLKIKDEQWLKIDYTKIVYVKASKNNSVLYFENETSIIYKSPIIVLQNKLPFYFERIHNSYLININYINSVDMYSKTVQLNNKIVIGIGQTYRDNIERYFISTRKKNDRKNQS